MQLPLLSAVWGWYSLVYSLAYTYGSKKDSKCRRPTAGNITRRCGDLGCIYERLHICAVGGFHEATWGHTPISDLSFAVAARVGTPCKTMRDNPTQWEITPHRLIGPCAGGPRIEHDSSSLLLPKHTLRTIHACKGAASVAARMRHLTYFESMCVTKKKVYL